jgi:hypothetical protein
MQASVTTDGFVCWALRMPLPYQASGRNKLSRAKDTGLTKIISTKACFVSPYNNIMTPYGRFLPQRPEDTKNKLKVKSKKQKRNTW